MQDVLLKSILPLEYAWKLINKNDESIFPARSNS